jgi:voltage-gated potassium channel Kch
MAGVTSVNRALSSPARNLAGGAAFVLTMMVLGVIAYALSGWSWGDALYMVVLTIFTVGYDEVRPINTPALRGITIGLIVFGCTGMIFVTGALVQFITAVQFSEILGVRRMISRIDKLRSHVIVCGFGRIGSQLVRALHSAHTPFLILEANQDRCTEAQDRGYLCLHGDATQEGSLLDAGIMRAKAVVTVLPDDAANVFITLSARSLNKNLMIIARGEAPSTEAKLFQAGADRVVLPAHIGAERIAELLLFPDTAGPVGPRTMEQQLRSLGIALDIVVAEEGSPWVGLTVGEIEAATRAPFFIVEIERADSGMRERATQDMRIHQGDGIVVVGRSVSGALQGLSAPRG